MILGGHRTRRNFFENYISRVKYIVHQGNIIIFVRRTKFDFVLIGITRNSRERFYFLESEFAET